MPKSARSQSLPRSAQAPSAKNEGFFARLKRRFRIGSKGSYSVGGSVEGISDSGQYIPRTPWRGDDLVEDPLGGSDTGHQIASSVSSSITDTDMNSPPTMVCQRADMKKYKQVPRGKTKDTAKSMRTHPDVSEQDTKGKQSAWSVSGGTPSADQAGMALPNLCTSSVETGSVKETFPGDIVQNDFVLSEESAIDLDDEVFTLASPPPQASTSAAAAAAVPELLEEPGYETLENIRKQIEDKTEGDSAQIVTPEGPIISDPGDSIQVKCDSVVEIKEQTSKTSLDSGLGSPGQETQSPNLESERSSAGSVTSDRGSCSVSSATSKVLDTRMVSSFHTVHPGPVCQRPEDEEIYSNFQIALRKQSVRKCQSEPEDVSVCHVTGEILEEMSPSEDVALRTLPNSACSATAQSNPPEPAQYCSTPPPLPDRRYSSVPNSTETLEGADVAIGKSTPGDALMSEADLMCYEAEVHSTEVHDSILPDDIPPPLPDRKYSTTDIHPADLLREAEEGSSSTPATSIITFESAQPESDTISKHEILGQKGCSSICVNEISGDSIQSGAVSVEGDGVQCKAGTGPTSSEEANRPDGPHKQRVHVVIVEPGSILSRGSSSLSSNVKGTTLLSEHSVLPSLAVSEHTGKDKRSGVHSESSRVSERGDASCASSTADHKQLHGVSCEVGELVVCTGPVSPRGNRRSQDKVMVDVVRGSVIIRNSDPVNNNDAVTRDHKYTRELENKISSNSEDLMSGDVTNTAPTICLGRRSKSTKLASGVVGGRSDVRTGQAVCEVSDSIRSTTTSQCEVEDSHVVCADEGDVNGHDSVGLPEPTCSLPDETEQCDGNLYHDEEPIHMTLEEVLGPSHPANMAASKVKRSSRHTEIDEVRAFRESMQQLKECGWYWGPLNSDEAEIKLSNKPDGSFLVRDSANENYILSLTFKSQGRIHHTRIEHFKGKFGFWSQPESHGKTTIKEFIEQAMENSRSGHFKYFLRAQGPGLPPIAMYLLYPVSRFKSMRSLMHMCRFTILQLVRRDHVDYLPIPMRIKKYLQEHQYYAEIIDDEADDVIGFEGNNNIVRR